MVLACGRLERRPESQRKQFTTKDCGGEQPVTFCQNRQIACQAQPLRSLPDGKPPNRISTVSISKELLESGARMPEKETIERAREDAQEGKAPTTQAGEFVREEIHHVREGKHGARSPQHAIAIGLSKARRAGVTLPPPPNGTASARKTAKGKSHRTTRRPSSKRSHAITRAPNREDRRGTSHRALARHARTTPRTRLSSGRARTTRSGSPRPSRPQRG